MLIAYIAHPIGGDVVKNVDRVITIVRRINIDEPHVVPLASYLVDVLALDDNDPAQRARGIANNTTLLTSGVVDIIRLYGDRVSAGMEAEVRLALDNQIPVMAMNAATAVGLARIKATR